MGFVLTVVGICAFILPICWFFVGTIADDNWHAATDNPWSGGFDIIGGVLGVLGFAANVLNVFADMEGWINDDASFRLFVIISIVHAVLMIVCLLVISVWWINLRINTSIEWEHREQLRRS